MTAVGMMNSPAGFQFGPYIASVLKGFIPCYIPTLIIAAKQDCEVGYKDQFDLMSIYKNSTYCAVDKAGHNLQIEQPIVFENLVRSWLNTH